MRRRTLPQYVALALWLLAATQLAPAQIATTAPTARPAPFPEIEFTVSMPRPFTHLLEVEMRVRAAAGQTLPAPLELRLPVWTPGSYLVRDFARHVQDFSAFAADGQKNVPAVKTTKNTWRLALPASAREARVTYRVYANELTVRTNELNDRHAFWNNAALLMYVEGALAAPAILRVVPPAGWKTATGLPPVPARENTFRAENFDVLYDSPVEVGTFQSVSFEVEGVPHRIVVDGEGNYDLEVMRRDVRRIVEATLELMGGRPPYRDYTFILHTRVGGGGGLEHANSTALITSPFNFRTPALYRRYLGLVAHEFFHVWNVKLIRPDALGPFDYTRENHTRLLWFAEGATSYYEEMLPRRAGLITEKETLEALAALIQKIERTPGRRVLSLEEASFDAWIKYYRQDENAINSQVSYYDKGALVSLLLDLEIRRLSKGARALDDVLRALYADYGQRGRNYTPEDLQRAAERVAGASLEKFFTDYVRGRAELDYDRAFAPFGLRLERGDPKAAPQTFLSDDLRQDADRLLITRVVEGTPAYEQGLNAGDQIVALDGFRVTRETLLARLAEKRPGEVVRLTIFRFDQLSTMEIKLGSRPAGNFRFVPLPERSSEQTRLYEGWMKAGRG